MTSLPLQLTFLQSCYPTCIPSSHLNDLNVKLTYPVISFYLNRFSLLMWLKPLSWSAPFIKIIFELMFHCLIIIITVTHSTIKVWRKGYLDIQYFSNVGDCMWFTWDKALNCHPQASWDCSYCLGNKLASRTCISYSWFQMLVDLTLRYQPKISIRNEKL